MALLLCGFGVSALARAQEGARNDSPQKQPPVLYGHLSGTVFCSDTHRVARGATVLAWPVENGNKNFGSPIASVTGLDGVYMIDRAPVGEYMVLALSPGYMTVLSMKDIMDFEKSDAKTRADTLKRIGTVRIAENQSATKDVTIDRGAVIAGHVAFADGTPATDASIEVRAVHVSADADVPDDSSSSPIGPMEVVTNHQTLATDDQGNFRISGLPGGTYSVAAVQSGGGSAGSDWAVHVGGNGDETALRVYVGDTLHRKDAKLFKVMPGDVVSGLAITIPLDAFHRVHGSFSATDGRALNSADLTLTDTSDASFVYRTKLAPDGSFDFPNVPAGAYTLEASNGAITRPDGDDGTVPVNAFANASAALIVKNSDLVDVTLLAKEIPLPKQAPDDGGN